MNRLFTLSALLGLAMTGTAAAATANVSIDPVNGSCPAGFEMQKSTSGTDDLCVQTSSASSGSIMFASFSGGDDDDHDGSNDHDGRDNDDHDGDNDHDNGGDHDSDRD